MWDMPDNATSIAQTFVKADKPVGAVCHAPAALVNVRGKDGEYLVRKRVTGFTNAEEEAVGLTAVVPAGRPAKGTGSIYSKTANWVPYVQVDGARDRTESIFGTRSGSC